jgi:hypothetical protein
MPDGRPGRRGDPPACRPLWPSDHGKGGAMPPADLCTLVTAFFVTHLAGGAMSGYPQGLGQLLQGPLMHFTGEASGLYRWDVAQPLRRVQSADHQRRERRTPLRGMPSFPIQCLGGCGTTSALGIEGRHPGQQLRSAVFTKSLPNRVAQCRANGLISENSAINCITLENGIFANRMAAVELNALHEFRQWVIDKIPLRFMHRVMLLAECEGVGKTLKFESVLRQHGRHPLHLSRLAPSRKTALDLAFRYYGSAEVGLWHRVCSNGH